MQGSILKFTISFKAMFQRLNF